MCDWQSGRVANQSINQSADWNEDRSSVKRSCNMNVDVGWTSQLTTSLMSRCSFYSRSIRPIRCQLSIKLKHWNSIRSAPAILLLIQSALLFWLAAPAPEFFSHSCSVNHLLQYGDRLRVRGFGRYKLLKKFTLSKNHPKISLVLWCLD